MKLRRWVLLTALLYAATLAALTLPILAIAFWDDIRLADVSAIYAEPAYWLGIGLLGLLQAIFLLLPLHIARERPERRGPWLRLAIVAGLMMGLLIFALVVSVAEAITLRPFGDDIGVTWGVWAGLGGWAFWGIAFAFYAMQNPRASTVRHTVNRLLASSVTELLVAVPSHVYVRHKNYCCAGFGTFVGIAVGLSVMLFAFGPGVFLLFVARVKALRGPLVKVQDLPRVAEPLLKPHAKDAVFFAGAALVFLLLPLPVIGLRLEATVALSATCFMAALVFAGASLVRGVRAWRQREPWWGLPLALSAMLAEAAIMAIWWGIRNL